jgi:hypothetical protein
MFCPSCGQEQISEATRFCSRCGLLLTGVAQIMYNGGGSLPALDDPNLISPRKKGVKQGVMIMLSSLVLVPLIITISIALRIPPPLSIIVAILTLGGGFLRLMYALLFESGNPTEQNTEPKMVSRAKTLIGKKQKIPAALPPQQEIPASGYIPPHQGSWRDTNDLEPQSVTEGTTKLIKEEPNG